MGGKEHKALLRCEARNRLRYLWWVSKKGVQFKTAVGRGVFCARGHLGQYIIVAPERRVVVVQLNDGFKRHAIEGGWIRESVAGHLCGRPEMI
jgi:hypothetical protein